MYNRGSEQICNPPLSEWATLVRQNKAALAAAGHPVAQLRERFREEVITAALDFEACVLSYAQAAGFDWRPPQRIVSSSGVIMAGHQPVIYHSGILEKTRLLSVAAQQLNLQGINIVIDTDAGDSGALLFPNPAGGVATLSISSPQKLYLGQRLLGTGEIKAVFERIVESLRSYRKHAAAESTQKIGSRYAALAGAPMTIANSLLRRIAERSPCYLELPLSTLASLPSTQKLIHTIISDAREFHRSYNQSLETHRSLHRIKNAANPFPNLRAEGADLELPFWKVQPAKDTREPFFTSAGTARLPDDPVVVPRGALITTIFRLLGCDLFIHGLGGATYEPVGDQLLAQYFHLTSSQFTTVSANRYLFTDEISHHEKLLANQDALKRIPTRILEYLDRGLFSTEEEEVLRSLHARRITLVEALQQGKAARSDVRQIGAELKEVDGEIKKFLSASSFAKDIMPISTSPATMEQWYCRSFPFFYLSSF